MFVSIVHCLLTRTTGETRWELPEGHNTDEAEFNMDLVRKILDTQGKLATPSGDTCQAENERVQQAHEEFCKERQRQIEILQLAEIEKNRIQTKNMTESQNEVQLTTTDDDDMDQTARKKRATHFSWPGTEGWERQCHERFDNFIQQRKSQILK